MVRLIITAFLLLSTASQAKDLEGTIFLKNGTEKTGYIKSFLENDFFKANKPYGNVIDKLNLNDEKIKYKENVEDKYETIETEDIIKIELFKDGKLDIAYKPLRAGGVNSNGELEFSKKKIWMPLVWEGKIEIYGFTVRKTDWKNQMNSGIYYFYFLKYPNEDKAIAPLSELKLLQLLNNEIVLKAALEELKLLITDCPAALEPLKVLNEKLQIDGEKKKVRKEFKRKRKESEAQFKSEYPDADRMMLNFAVVYSVYYDAIKFYNEQCN